MKPVSQCMYRLPTVVSLIRALACTLILLLLSGNVPAQADNTTMDCATELDAAVALATNPDNDLKILEARFASLENTCPAFAQLAHNLGVLAARDNRWPQAIAHFERSLSKDTRAADTQRHLQEIFEYRAAQSYAKVLQTPLTAQPPKLQFQDSAIHNSDSEQSFPEHRRLRDIATVEYELFAWWQARKNWRGVRGHYVAEFDIEAIKLARQEKSTVMWADTKREIAFTEQDAVVVISEPDESKTLLLMRLVGSRWKIYQETRL